MGFNHPGLFFRVLSQSKILCVLFNSIKELLDFLNQQSKTQYGLYQPSVCLYILLGVATTS